MFRSPFLICAVRARASGSSSSANTLSFSGGEPPAASCRGNGSPCFRNTSLGDVVGQYRCFGLCDSEHPGVEQLIERFEHLDIGVEVDAAFVTERVAADIVRGKGLCPASDRFPDPRHGVHVETALVPADDLVTGQHPAPRFHALPAPFGVFALPQPAEVDFLGYHSDGVSWVAGRVYRTRSERPMRRMVVDLMPFSRQMFETVVPWRRAMAPSVSPERIR